MVRFIGDERAGAGEGIAPITILFIGGKFTGRSNRGVGDRDEVYAVGSEAHAPQAQRITDHAN